MPRTLTVYRRILLSCALILGAGFAPDYSCAANTADLNSYIGPAAAECFTKFRLRIQTGYSHGRRNCPQREAMITQDFPPGQSYQAGLQSVFNPQENAFCFVDGYAGAHENHSVEFSVDPPIAPGTHTVRLSYNQTVQDAPPYDGLQINWNGVTLSFVPVPALPSTASCAGFTPGEGFNLSFGQSDEAKIIVPNFCQMGPAFILEKFSGDDQTGLVGQVLPQALKVRALGTGSAPVPGVSVTFTIIQTPSGLPEGSLSASTVVTDSSGIAGVELTLSTNPGSYQVRVDVPVGGCGVAPIIFNETAISSITAISGVIANMDGLNCTSVSMGEQSAPIMPDGSYHLNNVPVVLGSLLFPEDHVTFSCDNPDVTCPLVNASSYTLRGNDCGHGGYEERSGGQHFAIDLYPTPQGTSGQAVKAAASGTVIFVGEFAAGDVVGNRSWGWVVIVRSDKTIGGRYEYLLYGHLKEPTLALGPDPMVPVTASSGTGTHVNLGDTIGFLGRTGVARFAGCDPHMHFEARQSAILIDPVANPSPRKRVLTNQAAITMQGPNTHSNYANSQIFKNVCLERKGTRCVRWPDMGFPPGMNYVEPDCQFSCQLYKKCSAITRRDR